MRVLAVDDSFDWLNIHSTELESICEDGDLELISACSATEALNIYKDEYLEKPFELVITDLQMESDFDPLYAGEWLIKEIQELNPDQKILVISSHFDIDVISNNYGVDYLSKRFIISDPTNYQLKLTEIFT